MLRRGGSPAGGHCDGRHRHFDHRRRTQRRTAVWTAIALLGAVAWGILALARGESVNAVWLIVAALGENAYQHYLEHRGRDHPGDRPLSRREFERRRMDRMEVRPGQRRR